MTTHTQVTVRNHEGGRQVVWIPTENARVDNFVRLKENGKWLDGWEVIAVYPGALPSEVIQERSRDFKSHRKATDV